MARVAGRGVGGGTRSDEQFEPRMVLLDAEGRVIAGELAMNHVSIVGPTVGIVSQDHDAIAG